MGFLEFVALVAAIMALNPLAMDLMLPALPDVGAAYQVANPNRLQTVLSVFIAGFGVGQLIMGSLSDRFGRRPILVGGMVVYAIASAYAVTAPSFEALLVARALQGAGTSATRVIATTIIRDCYTGRRMASVVSLAMMIFISVPVIAPSIGQAIMLTGHWRTIFVVLAVYGIAALLWSVIRLPETLPQAERKSLALSQVFDSFRQTLTTRQTLGYALAGGTVQGVLYAYVLSSQQIFTGVYQLGHLFPLAFAAVALGIAFAGFLNSRIVGRFGMRVISHAAMLLYIAISIVMLAGAWWNWLPLPLYMLLSIGNMFAFGMSYSNFTALAMEPQGHIAGTASSIYGSITTLISVLIGYAIGQSFDGTLVPFGIGAFICTLAAFLVVLVTEKGRLFVPRKAPV
jgi:DHA1 family bicyclomycin/chloramphenicol resistance-like MFS transporter